MFDSSGTIRMQTDDFSYDLPQSLIAQEPLAERDSCRLLVLNRQNGSTEHLFFRDLLDIVRPGDRLVFNNTKVIPARVLCRKTTGASIELFFTEKLGDNSWRALVKPAKRVPPGSVIHPEDDPNTVLRIEEVMEDGYERRVKLVSGKGCLEDVIEKHGHMPLPHYIQREDDEMDKELYQTVYAKSEGAVAAPTAGLHFTEKMLEELENRGVDKSFVTLHVGIGTFRPVAVENPRDHDIHEERYELSSQTAAQINSTWERGGRVIAVGTTVVRVLETCAVCRHKIEASSGKTKIMILPPWEFRALDGLITNFHLPRSTLLMLVSALSTRERVLCAYREAVRRGYRFYSYGDAMLII
ncbi:MAG: tRNA preQ1(34) S-adenosylmethionine ribosyltransferase-isomerase QueA [Chitinispirillaceae bacterium]